MAFNITPGSRRDDEDVEGYRPRFRLTIITCLSVSAVLGFTGNAFVVAVIFRAKKLRSVMNRFVLHLAISDLIVCSLCIPLFMVVNFRFAADTATSGTADMAKCKMTRFLQYLAPEASMTILITIGLNRYRAIVHPLHGMTYGTANKLITAAWSYALVMVAPSLYLTEVKPVHENSTALYCATIPGNLLGRLYTVFLGAFGYLLPLAVLIILYGKICKTVWLRQKNNLGHTMPVKAHIQSRKKALRMFLTVTLIFLVSWLPLLIYVGAIEFTKPAPSPFDYTRLVVYSIGLFNSVLNPFIYALFNPRFRSGCKDLCKSVKLFRFRTKPPNPTPGTQMPNGNTPDQFRSAFHRRFTGSFHTTEPVSGGKTEAQSGLCGMEPLYVCFKEQDFRLNSQEEHYRSNYSISTIIDSPVELTMFRCREL